MSVVNRAIRPVANRAIRPVASRPCRPPLKARSNGKSSSCSLSLDQPCARSVAAGP